MTIEEILEAFRPHHDRQTCLLEEIVANQRTIMAAVDILNTAASSLTATAATFATDADIIIADIKAGQPDLGPATDAINAAVTSFKTTLAALMAAVNPPVTVVSAVVSDIDGAILVTYSDGTSITLPAGSAVPAVGDPKPV